MLGKMRFLLEKLVPAGHIRLFRSTIRASLLDVVNCNGGEFIIPLSISLQDPLALWLNLCCIAVGESLIGASYLVPFPLPLGVYHLVISYQSGVALSRNPENQYSLHVFHRAFDENQSLNFVRSLFSLMALSTSFCTGVLSRDHKAFTVESQDQFPVPRPISPSLLRASPLSSAFENSELFSYAWVWVLSFSLS